MPVVMSALLYIGAHFLVYAAAARNQRTFRSERAIVLYHALPFVLMCAALTALGVTLGFRRTLPALILGICLLSLYSMSFLEIWAISDGSIYFRLLCRLADGRGQPVELREIANLEEDGRSRRDVRQDGLVALKLVKSSGARLRLTAAGGCVHRVLGLIAWTVAADRPCG